MRRRTSASPSKPKLEPKALILLSGTQINADFDADTDGDGDGDADADANADGHTQDQAKAPFCLTTTPTDV